MNLLLAALLAAIVETVFAMALSASCNLEKAGHPWWAVIIKILGYPFGASPFIFVFGWGAVQFPLNELTLGGLGWIGFLFGCFFLATSLVMLPLQKLFPQFYQKHVVNFC